MLQNALFSRYSKAASSAKDDLNAKKAAPPPTGALIVFLFMYLFICRCVYYYPQYLFKIILLIRHITEFRVFVITKVLSSTNLEFHHCF